MSEMNEIMNSGNLVDNGGTPQVDAAQQMEQTQNLEDAFSEVRQEESQPSESEVQEEVQPEQPQQESQTDAEFAKKFAALSRRDKEIRLREQELEQRAAELSDRVRQLEEKSQPVEEVAAPEAPLEYRLRSNPLETLESMGIGYEKLTEMVLNDGQIPHDLKMDVMKRELEDKYSKQLDELKNELTQDKQTREEEKLNQTINNFKGELANFVNNDESYEFIRANDAVEMVYNVIETQYQETQRVLDIKEAADAVESYLEEESKKFLKLNKVQRMMQPKQEEIKPKQVPSQSPTLSNNMASQVPTRTSKQLSDEESKSAIAAMLKWDD
jgi:hypothetical protein